MSFELSKTNFGLFLIWQEFIYLKADMIEAVTLILPAQNPCPLFPIIIQIFNYDIIFTLFHKGEMKEQRT